MQKIFSTQEEKEKAFLLGVAFKKDDGIESQMAELARLAETAGLDVVGQDFQVIREVTPSTLFGSGKVEEFAKQIEETDADVVIVDTSLTGSQTKNLSDVFGTKVIDRMGLILDIFALRATSAEGKLQVELAQLKYSLPRLASLQNSEGRFGGGVGMRGPGETKLELNRRVVDKKIQKLTNDLKDIQNKRNLTRQKRNSGGKKQVAIVGYTNAGKSTLLNLITKADIYADDKLFATLDTTSRNVFLSPECQIILTDTVGFISKLPHEFVEAFASTLDEAKNADLILQVVDVSNKDYKSQMDTVEKTLQKIGASQIPQIVVYNKVDSILPATPMIKLKENEVFISAKKNVGIDNLKNLIINFLNK